MESWRFSSSSSNWKMPPCETQKLHEGEASIFQDIKFGCFTTMCFSKITIFFWTEILTSVFRRWAVGCLWCIYHGFIGVCLFPSSSKAVASWSSHLQLLCQAFPAATAPSQVPLPYHPFVDAGLPWSHVRCAHGFNGENQLFGTLF